MTTDDDEPATKGELRLLRAELKMDMAELKAEMKAMEKRIVRDLSEVVMSALNLTAEQHARETGVLDDKDKDLPGRVSTLERDVDEHRRDFALHKKPRKN